MTEEKEIKITDPKVTDPLLVENMTAFIKALVKENMSLSSNLEHMKEEVKRLEKAYNDLNDDSYRWMLMPDEPIKVASNLIDWCDCREDSISAVKQIAEHLLIYVNSQGE